LELPGYPSEINSSVKRFPSAPFPCTELNTPN
jgi:hypothetical protein